MRPAKAHSLHNQGHEIADVAGDKDTIIQVGDFEKVTIAESFQRVLLINGPYVVASLTEAGADALAGDVCIQK